MRKHIVAIVCAAIVAIGAGVSAQSAKITLVKTPQGVRFLAPFKPTTTTGETKIIGAVVDITQTPVKHVKLQLRSLVTGKVEKVAESNDNGEYEFLVDNPGTYVVEMVMADGRVLALSNAGTLGHYETMHTVVQLPGRWDLQTATMIIPQNPGSYFGMSARTTMSAATLNLAIEASVTPVNSGEPVSATAPK